MLANEFVKILNIIKLFIFINKMNTLDQINLEKLPQHQLVEEANSLISNMAAFINQIQVYLNNKI